MPEKLCERCEMIVGMGCACPTDGRAPKALDPSRSGPAAGPDVTCDKILISPTDMAHIPGACVHYADGPLDEAGWGWVSGAGTDVWTRISGGNPLQATAGNTSRRAMTRCAHCAEFLGFP
ncbi:hypothetical protein AB0H82_09865 [Streptomyces sp. NPDC050732]|uniref:hypothetical protein n=1 Tax=Streptomyces sp. NPDC050732 TaxID=3154632 RepID=UPI003436C705